MQSTPLQEWAEANDPSETDLIYKDGFWDQIMFVRDKLPGIVYKMYSSDYETAKGVMDTMQAQSSHTSKSVRLPVYHMTLPDGTECVLRYNFYDWKVSVKAARTVTCDFVGLFSPDIEIHDVYCEGFPKEWVFGSFGNNQQEFTLELGSEYEVFMFFWLLISNLVTQQNTAAA